jgi:hypothetical protein
VDTCSRSIRGDSHDFRTVPATLLIQRYLVDSIRLTIRRQAVLPWPLELERNAIAMLQNARSYEGLPTIGSAE